MVDEARQLWRMDPKTSSKDRLEDQRETRQGTVVEVRDCRGRSYWEYVSKEKKIKI